MRSFRFLHLAILTVLVGSAALMYAQDEKPQEDKAARQEDAKPQPKQDEAKPTHPEDARPSDAKPSKQEEPKQDNKRAQEQATPERQDHPEMRNDHEQQGQEHAAQHAEGGRPAGKGGHIPDDKFHASFGRSHTFRAQTVIVSGQPQFQYGGYSFQLVDAWPVGWAYTDECYIDYIDGEYFLFDLLHPGVRVAVFVVM
jgi:hypothetical protein